MKLTITTAVAAVLFTVPAGVSWAAEAKLGAGVKVLGHAALEPKSGSKTGGDVTLGENAAGALVVEVTLKNATKGAHGIHVHEVGNCADAEAKSAGDHFNPGAHPHASPKDAKRHAGDLGNVMVGEDGLGLLKETIDPPADKKYKWSDLVGKSIVVHEKKDDLTTQPSGASGKRIACGVIQVAAAP